MSIQPINQPLSLSDITLLTGEIDPVVAAIAHHNSRMMIEARQAALLHSMVFSLPLAVPINKMTQNRDQKLLLKHDAYSICAIIWKESEFVPKAALAKVGIKRWSDESTRQISERGIAQLLSCNDQSLLKGWTARVSRTTIAARNYGLVTRESISKTELSIRGTALLHEFMVEAARIEVRLGHEQAFHTSLGFNQTVGGK